MNEGQINGPDHFTTNPGNSKRALKAATMISDPTNGKHEEPLPQSPSIITTKFPTNSTIDSIGNTPTHVTDDDKNENLNRLETQKSKEVDELLLQSEIARTLELITKNKLVDIIFLYLCMTYIKLKMPFDIRFEWLLFCMLSVGTLTRAKRNSWRIFISVALLLASLDGLIGYSLYCSPHIARWTPQLADQLIYFCTISYAYGFKNHLSWAIWFVFLLLDICFRGSFTLYTVSGKAIAAHTVGYGIYLFTAEILGWLVLWHNGLLGTKEDDFIESILSIAEEYMTRIWSVFDPTLINNRVDLVLPRFLRIRNLLNLVFPGRQSLDDLLSKPDVVVDTPFPSSPSSSSLSSSSSTFSVPSAPYPHLAIEKAHPATSYTHKIELCILEITSFTAAFSWTIEPRNRNLHSTLQQSIASRSLSHLANHSSLGSFISSVTFQSVHTYPHTPMASQILVRIDNLPWHEVEVRLPEFDVFIVYGLAAATEYSVEMSITGINWPSGQVDICTMPKADIPTQILPHQISSLTESPQCHRPIAITEPSSLTSEPEPSLSCLRTQLQSDLEAERRLKQEAAVSFKKLRRELTKSGQSLRGEIETMRRAFSKASGLEIKTKQRVETLEQTNNQLRLDTDELVNQLHVAKTHETHLHATLNTLTKRQITLKEQLKKVEKNNQRVQQANNKAAEAFEGKMKQLEREREEIVRQATRLRQTEIPNLRSRMAEADRLIAIEREKTTTLQAFLASQTTAAKKKTKKEVAIYAQLDLFKEKAYKIEGKSKILRATVAAERKFKDQLEKELENFRREAVEGYFGYREGRGGRRLSEPGGVLAEVLRGAGMTE